VTDTRAVKRDYEIFIIIIIMISEERHPSRREELRGESLRGENLAEKSSREREALRRESPGREKLQGESELFLYTLRDGGDGF
jgi:hypothetical protein